MTLELLPERIDLAGFVLQWSGLGSLAPVVVLGADDDRYAKYGTLVGASTGLALFVLLLSVQRIGWGDPAGAPVAIILCPRSDS